MKSMNQYCREQFGEKLYKLSLDGGFTCPNRDGTMDTRGCIFCSRGGSGEFTPAASLSMEEQLRLAKERIAQKYHGNRYIAYFQAFTNTYASPETLLSLYMPIVQREEIAALSIATRPDCLSPDILAILDTLNQVKPLWVELGLQTTKPESIAYIRRAYPTDRYDRAIERLNSLHIHTITHVILGLPGEDEEDMLNTVRHVVKTGSQGIKLQLLHVLAGTELAEHYARGEFETLSLEAYIQILKRCVSLLPADMVVHRLTGDGAKKDLIAPLWSGDKKRVLNAIRRELLL